MFSVSVRFIFLPLSAHRDAVVTANVEDFSNIDSDRPVWTGGDPNKLCDPVNGYHREFLSVLHFALRSVAVSDLADVSILADGG